MITSDGARTEAIAMYSLICFRLMFSIFKIGNSNKQTEEMCA